MAKLATGHTRGETVVADGDFLVDKLVGEIVGTLCHCSDKHTHALLRPDGLNPISDAHQWSIETEGNLAAVGWQVVTDWVLDDSQELFLGSGRADRKSMQQLYHETSKPLKGSGNSDGGGYFNQHALGRVDINLQLAGLVDRRIEQREQTLGAAQSAC